MASVKQMIQPHFWFDKEAREAVEFYVSVFPESKLTNEKTLHDTPSGNAAFFNLNYGAMNLWQLMVDPISDLILPSP